MKDRSELRRTIARLLDQHAGDMAADVLTVLPFTSGQPAVEQARQPALALVELLAVAVRIGAPDAGGPESPVLDRLAGEQRLPTSQILTLVYLLEHAALDVLALDTSTGTASEPWPVLAQIVRRASFDVIAAVATHREGRIARDPLIDPETTLYTGQVLTAALDKEIHRAERGTHPFALVMIGVDRLAAIGTAHGGGVEERVFERIGIVLRRYFREQDWVARCAGARFGVLLPETTAAHARLLAERVRATVHDRLSLPDDTGDRQVPITVSVAVVTADALDAGMRAADFVREAELAVLRAQDAGGNRVVDVALGLKAALPERDGA